MKKCHICGKKALELIELCPECLGKTKIDQAQIKKIKQISNILSITANTDTNIKECMESLLEIAQDLERRNSGGKEEKEEQEPTAQEK